MKLTSTQDYIRDLNEACRWLDIKRGRATEYANYLKKTLSESTLRLSKQEVLVCFEAYEPVDIYHLWRENVDRFPGLKDKLKQVFKKGPLLTDLEVANQGGSVKSRNDAFSAFLAGLLMKAKFDLVQVEGCSREDVKISEDADSTIKVKEKYINIECKRPHSHKNWLDSVVEAGEQIKNSGKKGIVALDCSVLFRPPETVFRSAYASDALVSCQAWQRQIICPEASKVLSLEPKVTGLILYARIPALTMTEGVEGSHMCSVVSWLLIPDYESAIGNRVMNDLSSKLQVRDGMFDLIDLLQD